MGLRDLNADGRTTNTTNRRRLEDWIMGRRNVLGCEELSPLEQTAREIAWRSRVHGLTERGAADRARQLQGRESDPDAFSKPGDTEPPRTKKGAPRGAL